MGGLPIGARWNKVPAIRRHNVWRNWAIFTGFAADFHYTKMQARFEYSIKRNARSIVSLLTGGGYMLDVRVLSLIWCRLGDSNT